MEPDPGLVGGPRRARLHRAAGLAGHDAQARLGLGLPLSRAGESELARGADDQTTDERRDGAQRGSDGRTAPFRSLRRHLRDLLAHLRLRRLSLDQARRVARGASAQALKMQPLTLSFCTSNIRTILTRKV